MKTSRKLILAAMICLLFGTSSALAGVASPYGQNNTPGTDLHEKQPKNKNITKALDLGDVVDFDAAQLAGVEYLRVMQADITEDNAGNGTDGVDETPDDPDDGGWDWSLNADTVPFHHSTSASPTNIYGATAMGLYYTYLEQGGVTYLTAMTDAADTMANNPNIRSGADVVFLMLYNDLPGVSGTAYMDSARAKYDSRIASYGSATAFAEYIRDVRAGQGYENGIIAWDIGIWARAAAMLHDRFPGSGYDTDADDIAEVIWQDSFNDSPGYFDVIDDQGFDPGYADYNFYWYNLGITGLIDAFDAADVHTSEIPGLVSILLDGQYSHGAFSYCYGANTDDEDWQSTAYVMMTLGRLDQATYQDELNRAGYYLGATQDAASGGWIYSSGNHYPEIGGECVAGLYFTTDAVTDVIVDDDFTSQADVDAYNSANGTNYTYGYDAFGSIQDAIDGVTGSTINVLPGTYTENIDVDKYVHIIGSGSGEDPASNTILTQNPTGAGDSKIGVIQLSASGNSQADPILIQDIRVAADGMAGISVGRFTEATGQSISYVELDNVIVVGNNVNPNTEQERGLYVDLTSSLSYLTITDCSFDSLTYGWYFQKEVSADASTVQYVDVTNTTFNHNNLKGIYAEKLSDVTFDGCTVSENGFSDAGVPSYFLPWMSGIDINLKAGTYANLIFNNCTVTDNALGGAKEGVGLTVKGRGTGNNPSGSYTAFPAWVDNVQVNGGTYTGNERGMRFGEPGKENASPTNVVITDADIYDNVQTYSGTDGSAYGDVVNQMMAGVSVSAEANWWGTIDYAAIDANTSGEVDFDPWCTDATHSNCTLTYPVTEVWVDDDWAGSGDGDVVGGHVFGYDAFATIQDGVDAVSGSTVNVAAGTYVEQVHITSDDLNLVGAGVGSTIIQSPASLTEYFTTSADNYPVVFVDGATGVVISDLTVDGDGLGNANYKFIGVGFWNGGGTLSSAEVLNIMDTPFSGNQHGVGVYAYNNTGGPYTVVVNDVVVDDFQKTAVALSGDGLTVDIDNVTVTGAGPTSVTAQNGIQIGFGAGGTVNDCSVTGIDYTGASWTASGALVYNATNVDMTNVDLDQCQSSIYYQDASGTIDGCSITNPSGDGLIAYSYAAKAGQPRATASPMDADLAVSGEKVAMTVTVSNTEILGTGAADSWATYAYASNGAITYTVTGCTVSDWTYGVVPYDDGPGVTADINNNAIVNCDYALGSSASDPAVHDAESNWYGVTAAADVAAMVDGAFDYSPWYGANYVNDPHSTPWVWYVDNVENSTIQEAIDGATAGDTVYVSPGVYDENISIGKALTLIGLDDGSKAVATISPTAAGGTAVTVNSDDVTIEGFTITYPLGLKAIVSTDHNQLAIRDNLITSIGTATTTGYVHAIAVVCNNADVDGITIEDNELSAIHADEYSSASAISVGWSTGTYDVTNLVIQNNYIHDVRSNTSPWNLGHGAYGILLNHSGNADGEIVGAQVLDNVIDDLEGLWSHGIGLEGNTPGALVQGNVISNLVDYKGPSDPDAAAIMVEDNASAGTVNIVGNSFVNIGVTTNGLGVKNVTGTTVLAEGNWWGTYDGPEDLSGTDEATASTCYDPSTMVNAVDEMGYGLGNSADDNVDYCPWVSEGVILSPTDILYHCSGSFTFDVSIALPIIGLEAGSYVFTYPAELTFEGLTVSDPNITAYTQLDDQATGYDELTVDFLVATGSLDGPADLFTIELSGSTSYCSGEDITLTSVEMYDTNNDLIDSPLPGAITLVADCNDPVFTVNSPSDGGFYNTAPVLDIGATDDCDIDAVYYQIDGCDDASWTAIAGPGYSGASFADGAWTVPGFAGLTEDEHCVRFKVIDDNERGNADSCSYTWCFTKDISAPAPPTNLVAEPGHNKVKLSWSSSTSGDVVGYRIQRVAWADYPWYLNGSEPAYPADEASGTNVFDGTGNAHTDTHLLDNTTRDVYYYAIFAYDAAGNYSPADPAAQDRSTSYWLGDIADALTTFGNYDGFIDHGDLTQLGFTYWSSYGDAEFEPEADWGPTVTSDPKGIPEPDSTIDILDLAIFAINYGAVNPTMKVVPLFADKTANGPLNLTLSGVEGQAEATYALSLNNAGGDAKIIHVVMELQGDVQMKSFEPQVDQEASGLPVFAKARQVDNTVEFDFALIGHGATIAGSGELAQFTFTGEGTAELVEALVLDNNNEEVSVSLVNGAKPGMDVPKTYELSQNYPNPFNPTTQIIFQLPKAGTVTLEVFNLVGQRVKVLVDEYREAGVHTVTWHGVDERGSRVSSGVYFYRLHAEGTTMTRKMMLLK